MAGSASRLEADFWVFGYGSLMWRPGFTFEARSVARVQGFRRRLCIYSHVYRGTPQKPGLVLGLDRGGECYGVAFRVDASLRAETISYLRERELVTDVYVETAVEALTDSGERVVALTYVADPNHPQYAQPMEASTLLSLVRQGRGVSGSNSEYVLNTYTHLRELGIEDPELAFLAQSLS